MKKYLSLVKFAHTVFALPFALIGLFLGFQTAGMEMPDWRLLILVVLCMVFARSAAMAFNRYLDRDIDARNERTRTREIPSGAVSPRHALGFVILNSALFILTTWFINPLCFFLSPVALLVVLGYSYTKRFTFLCHLVLGLGLALAPIGAYIAVTARFGIEPVVLGMVVLTWVSGFDIIYAMQDQEFDQEHKLFSIPSFLGKTRALWVSSGLHLLTACCLLLFGYLTGAGWISWSGTFVFILLLIYQHLLVKPHDLSRVNFAFFTTNGLASVLFACFVVGELLWKMLG
jgi:4-hydroxybenzoate polyprenyltransferase